MDNNSGMIYASGPTYADSINPASVNPSTATDFTSFGTSLSGGQYYYYLSYLDFDTSQFATTPDELFLLFFSQNNGVTIHLAVHDYGTLDTTDFLTPTDLSGLTIHQTVTLHNFGRATQLVSLDTTGLTIGNTWRFVVFTDDQLNAVVPVDDTQVYSVYAVLTGRTDFVDPGGAASYATEVATDSPIVWWRLNETVGTIAADSSGNSSTGTFVNTPTLGVPGFTADGNFAATFAQANDSKVVGNVSIANDFSTSGFSMEAIFETGAVDGGVSNYFAVSGFENHGEVDFEFFDPNQQDLTTGIFDFFVNPPAGGLVSYVLALFKANTITHLIGTIPIGGNINQALLYVNGDTWQSIWSTPVVQVHDYTGFMDHWFYAGGDGFNGTPGDNLDGTIDEPALYATALSRTRALRHYSSIFVPTVPGVVSDAVGTIDSLFTTFHITAHVTDTVGTTDSATDTQLVDEILTPKISSLLQTHLRTVPARSLRFVKPVQRYVDRQHAIKAPLDNEANFAVNYYYSGFSTDSEYDVFTAEATGDNQRQLTRQNEPTT